MAATEIKRNSPDIYVELWIDENGKPHSLIHFHSRINFKEGEAALKMFVQELQWQIDNKDRCPMNKKAL